MSNTAGWIGIGIFPTRRKSLLTLFCRAKPNRPFTTKSAPPQAVRGSEGNDTLYPLGVVEP